MKTREFAVRGAAPICRLSKDLRQAVSNGQSLERGEDVSGVHSRVITKLVPPLGDEVRVSVGWTNAFASAAAIYMLSRLPLSVLLAATPDLN